MRIEQGGDGHAEGDERARRHRGRHVGVVVDDIGERQHVADLEVCLQLDGAVCAGRHDEMRLD
ncbi:MAG: hypothetical protein WKF58_11750 [Ilumatobacteraceae bacterium]